jgi:hypothetical protein
MPRELDATKSAWPELVGMHGGDAITIIETERPDVFALRREEGDPEPPTFERFRVYVWRNGIEQPIVSRTPVIG